jgi:hypothetical protein
MTADRGHDILERLFSGMDQALVVLISELDKIPEEDLDQIHVMLLALEGFRLCTLLSEIPVAPAIRAFILADKVQRFALDPEEVSEAARLLMEVQTLRADGKPRYVVDMNLMREGAYTPLGVFIQLVVDNKLPTGVAKSTPGTNTAGHYLGICSSIYESIEESIGHYMATLVHSDEPKDLEFYRQMKDLLFHFQTARDAKLWQPALYSLRVLLQLLYAHLIDFDRSQKAPAPRAVEAEMKACVELLQCAWARVREAPDSPE